RRPRRRAVADGRPRRVAPPHLAGLKALSVSFNRLGNASILALMRARLTALEELDLTGPGRAARYHEDPIIRSPGLEALAAWAGLASVRSLTLNGNDVGRPGLRALLRSPHAGALKALSLREGRLDGQAMAEFVDAPAGPPLEELDLGENVLKDLGVAYVAQARCLRGLKALRLDRCEVPLSGGRSL